MACQKAVQRLRYADIPFILEVMAPKLNPCVERKWFCQAKHAEVSNIFPSLSHRTLVRSFLDGSAGSFKRAACDPSQTKWDRFVSRYRSC